MKSIKIFCLALCLQTALLYAHEPNGAYFEVRQDGNELTVEAEFPWTLRLALLKAFPQLDENPTQEAFDKALFDYFRNNIIVGEKGKVLKLKKVEQVALGHSHSVVYKLKYAPLQQTHGLSISNTCLFELYEDQRNYVAVFSSEGDKVTTMTTKDSSSLVISGNSPESHNRGIVFFVAFLCLAIGYGWSGRKSLSGGDIRTGGVMHQEQT